MRIRFINLALVLALVSISCQNKQQAESKEVSTIDSTLQMKVTEILKDKMEEISALSGQVIVMETKTGEVKAMVGIELVDSTTYQPCDNFAHAQETGLMSPVTLLAALESGKVKYTDTLDTRAGKRLYKGHIVKDANWHRGGWGKMTVERGIGVSSNICSVMQVEQAYGKNPKDFYTQLRKMSYGEPAQIEGIDSLREVTFLTPDSSDWESCILGYSSIGYYQAISPIQILTFYNAIANGGKMVKPMLYKDETEAINPKIASRANMDSLKKALRMAVTEGLSKPANSTNVEVSGRSGTIQISTNDDDTEYMSNTEYAAEFCGYFPSANPQYSIIISVNKMGLPASGGLMAGDVFRQIVDSMNK